MNTFIPFFFFFFSLFSILWGQTNPNLFTSEQLTKIQNGETLIEAREVPGKPWPELQLTRLVRALPQQVFELFTDWDSAPTYIPNMLKAKVIAEPSPEIRDIEYTVKVPILGKISYSVRNYLTKNGETYEVRWELLQSPLASSANGFLKLEPFNGQTLLRYQNLVEPKLPFVSQLKFRARDEALTTVEAIGKEAEKRYANGQNKIEISKNIADSSFINSAANGASDSKMNGNSLINRESP